MAELYSFRVDEDEADLVGGGSHQDRGDHRVDARRLPAPVPCDQQVWHLGEVHHHGRPAMSLPNATSSGCVDLWASIDCSTLPRVTSCLSRLGTSTPIADRPGIGARSAHQVKPWHTRCPSRGWSPAPPSRQRRARARNGSPSVHRVTDQVRLDAMAGEGTLEHATALFDPLPVEILFLAPLRSFSGGSFHEPDVEQPAD